jgi:hypothetical protein
MAKSYKCAVCHDISEYKETCPNCGTKKHNPKTNYCPICQAIVLEEGMCECCKLAEEAEKKKLGGVKGD